MVTKKFLLDITDNLSEERADLIASVLTSCAKKYGVDSMDVMAEFLANVLHESGEFRLKVESLYYTTPERLVAIWPTRFNLVSARKFVKNEPLLANEVYNGRMGNRPKTNDGFAFRGGGYAQITGRDAYTAYTAFINRRDNAKLTIAAIANLVQTTELFALSSAFWFFCEFKNLEGLAIGTDNFNLIVRRWNGGNIGLPDRKKYYERILRFS